MFLRPPGARPECSRGRAESPTQVYPRTKRRLRARYTCGAVSCDALFELVTDAFRHKFNLREMILIMKQKGMPDHVPDHVTNLHYYYLVGSCVGSYAESYVKLYAM